jgi:hypothetical protein
MPKARIRLIEAKQQYRTHAEYLSEYLKDLAPAILNSLSGWYGRWEATFSKDGNTCYLPRRTTTMRCGCRMPYPAGMEPA